MNTKHEYIDHDDLYATSDFYCAAVLVAHGFELVSVESDNTVKVRLQGACRGCPGAQMTLKMGVERLLKERIPEVKEVVSV